VCLFHLSNEESAVNPNLTGEIIPRNRIAAGRASVLWLAAKNPCSLMIHYLLIQGPSYLDLSFEAREQAREQMRQRLEEKGVRFVQYDWVWDEDDRCLLLAGQYTNPEDARYWIGALESMGFTVLIRNQLPGDETRN
jgi:hypothetical protein